MARSSRPSSGQYGKNAYRSNTRYSASPSRSRSRSRSRSPWRPGKELGSGKRQNEEDHYGKDSSGSRRSRNVQAGDHRQAHNEPRRDRSRSPWRRSGKIISTGGALTKELSRPANSKGKALGIPPAPTSEEKNLNGKQPAENVTTSKSTSNGTRTNDRSLHAEQSENMAENDKADTAGKLSDAEIIEQRRQKRVALRESLLQQALQNSTLPAEAAPPQSNSGPDSNVHTQPSTPVSPRTPNEVASPFSPAASTVDSQGDTISVCKPEIPLDVGGPSAADYNPTLDTYMQDGGVDQPSHDAASGVVAPEPTTSSKPLKELDMFTENDEEFNKFAAKDLAHSKPGPRALGQELLDDWDYDNGHYRIINNELLDGRYTVVQKIGIGTFATVVRAKDNQTDTEVAIKIARNNDTMLKAGMKEINFLERVNGQNGDENKHIIRLLRSFYHKKHLCLVFENLNMDLRQTLNAYGRDKGINLPSLRVYAHQMFQALAHLKSCSVLHVDIKPDNILVNDKLNVVKVCDFGTAIHIQDQDLNTPSQYLASRFYRAPEIILGIKPDYAIDMWSVGCTLFEMCTGRILFNGNNNNFMLLKIQKCLGKLTKSLIKKAPHRARYFDDNFYFYTQTIDPITNRLSTQLHNFNIKDDEDQRLSVRVRQSNPTIDVAEIKELVDLLDKCLKLDPALRITPEEALKHPFVTRMNPSRNNAAHKSN